MKIFEDTDLIDSWYSFISNVLTLPLFNIFPVSKIPFMNISDSIISILNILTRKWVIWKKSTHKGGIKTCLDIRLEALKVIQRQNVFVKYFKGNWKLLIEAWKTNMQKYTLFAIFFTHIFLCLETFM